MRGAALLLLAAVVQGTLAANRNTTASCTYEVGIDYAGGDVVSIIGSALGVNSAPDCCAFCAKLGSEALCSAGVATFTYDSHIDHCWCKAKSGWTKNAGDTYTSGTITR
jgi:hypothetical protein